MVLGCHVYAKLCVILFYCLVYIISHFSIVKKSTFHVINIRAQNFRRLLISSHLNSIEQQTTGQRPHLRDKLLNSWPELKVQNEKQGLGSLHETEGFAHARISRGMRP